MYKLLFICLFSTSFSFADSVNLFIDYDGVWAPTISMNGERTQLCASNKDLAPHIQEQISDFCKLEFGTNLGNIHFNHQTDSNIYLYANKKSNTVLAELIPNGEHDCNYSVSLQDNGELFITKSSDLCKYTIHNTVERDNSFLKVYSQSTALNVN